MLPLKVRSMKLLTVVLILIFLFQFYVLFNSLKNGRISFDNQSTTTATYQRLLDLGQSRKIQKLPLRQRCDSYFENLYLMDKDWSIGEISHLSYSFEANNKLEHYLKTYKELQNEYKKQGRPMDDELVKKVFEKTKKKMETNMLIEEKLKNSVGHLRVYGTCYIKNGNPEGHSSCLDIESRLFPWMTFESPIFERWDGSVVQNFPIMSDYYRYEGMGSSFKQPRTAGDSCFMYNLKEQFTGKGIVISVGDHLVDELINLIKVLRFHRNVLPIQFVHKGDLAVESKKRIIRLSRETLHLKDLYVIDFAPQEVWFVDANRCINPQYYHKFYRFANKWIAAIFNSFEDMILMDTDSIPFIKPEMFFELGNYPTKGLYFFKDRTSLLTIPEQFKELYFKLLPTEQETYLFEIPQAGELTYNNRLLAHNMRHSMESGIVVMNRKKHLLGILIAVHIQFWGPLTEHFHGEKEIFWLSQSIAGNENYEFNANSAGAIGAIQPATDRYPERIVGVQPAHIGADNQTLIWINSGVKNCKKSSSAAHDFDNLLHWRGRFSSKELLRDFYNAPIDIKAVVIPPETYKKWWNGEGAPIKGWERRTEYGCSGYMWAAYSKVGSQSTKEEETYGKVIHFDQQTMTFYNNISKLWIADVEVEI